MRWDQVATLSGYQLSSSSACEVRAKYNGINPEWRPVRTGTVYNFSPFARLPIAQGGVGKFNSHQELMRTQPRFLGVLSRCDQATVPRKTRLPRFTRVEFDKIHEIDYTFSNSRDGGAEPGRKIVYGTVALYMTICCARPVARSPAVCSSGVRTPCRQLYKGCDIHQGEWQ